jgi:hypothetical protein
MWYMLTATNMSTVWKYKILSGRFILVRICVPYYRNVCIETDHQLSYHLKFLLITLYRLKNFKKSMSHIFVPKITIYLDPRSRQERTHYASVANHGCFWKFLSTSSTPSPIWWDSTPLPHSDKTCGLRILRSNVLERDMSGYLGQGALKCI